METSLTVNAAVARPVLTRPSEVKALLEALGLRPSRALGQNFLVDANILALILESADITSDHFVLEIGPGLGVLTEALAARAAQVLAVEKDMRLESHLRERFAQSPNVTLRFEDALSLDWSELARAGLHRLVSNLPYSTGSAILAEFFLQPRATERAVVTLQLEVAQRLVAQPGSRSFGLLSVWAQAGYVPGLAKIISPTCFFPVPEVRSAVVLLKSRDAPCCPPEAKPLFAEITKRAFGQRRKQLKAIFSSRNSAAPDNAVREALDAVGVDLSLRPEAVGAELWGAAAALLCSRWKKKK